MNGENETNPGELPGLAPAVTETPAPEVNPPVAADRVNAAPVAEKPARVRKPKTEAQKEKDAKAKRDKAAAAKVKTPAPKVKAKKVPKAAKAEKRGRGRPAGSKNKPKVGKAAPKAAKVKKVKLAQKPDNDKKALVTYVSAKLLKQIKGAAKACNMAVARWSRDILQGQFA